jgi:peptidoglycan/xylan/chitin deacetylase (PgdA/CDA1 family)
VGKPPPRPRRLRRLLALAVLGLLAVLAVQPPVAMDVVARLASAIVWKVETTKPVAALTFDDGPDPVYTPQVLEILARHDVKATFFLVGRRARRRPDLLARIRAEGHEVANHTETHGRTLLQRGSTFEKELLGGEEALGLAAARVKLFRPPGIWLRHGYLTVLGSAYAYDPYTPTDYIEWVISRNLRPGAIVVLHDSGGNRSNTVSALPAILRAAKDDGLRFVTLSELLAAGRDGR